MAFTFEERRDMHFVYGLAEGDANQAARFYQERYPHRRQPAPAVFTAVLRRLGEIGNLAPALLVGRPRRNVAVEENVIQEFVENPSTSTRAVGSQLGIPQSSVWRLLNRERCHPFDAQKVHSLLPQDYPARLQFLQWCLAQHQNNPLFFKNVLFTDEAIFSQDGMFNSKNMHWWAENNPHEIFKHHHQHKFSFNIWAGIYGDSLVGPYLLPNRLDGRSYRIFFGGSSSRALGRPRASCCPSERYA